MSEKLGRPIASLEAAAAVVSGVAVPTKTGDACRVTVVGSGGASGTVQVRGSADYENWYDLGPAIVLAADGVETLWLPEPNTYVRADVDAYAAGAFDADIQIYA